MDGRTVVPGMTQTTADLRNDAEDHARSTAPEDMGARLDREALDVLFEGSHTTQLFTDEKVDPELIRRVYEDLRWAPTAMNNQPLRLELVESAEAKARLLPHMGEFNREKTEKAPLTLIASFDMDWHRHMPHLAPFREGFAEDAEGKPGMREGMGRPNGWLQIGYLILALRAHGLQVGPMAGFDGDGIDAEFHADNGWKSLLVLNVGHAPADHEKAQQPRQGRLKFEQVATVL